MLAEQREAVDELSAEYTLHQAEILPRLQVANQQQKGKELRNIHFYVDQLSSLNESNLS